MTRALGIEDLVSALALPAACLVEQRVPKTLLLERAANTSGDKRVINEGVQELTWLAVLKSSNVGVPEHRDLEREYLEIAVLRLLVKDNAKAGRLHALVHRAVPYPVVLLSQQGLRLWVSLAHKRWSQSEAGQTVVDGALVEVLVGAQGSIDEGLPEVHSPFLLALAMDRQPHASMFALYQGWIDTVVALQAARKTGAFFVAENPEQAYVRRDALGQCEDLERRIGRLRAAAGREKQTPKLVEMNLELARLSKALADARQRL